MKTVTLYRPVGQKEMDLIKESGYASFPPRLEWQPIFYPVLDLDYACQIARDWNTNDDANGNVGYVTRFEVPEDYFKTFQVQNVGAANHNELWVPAEELPNFNKQLVRGIKLIDAFYGERDLAEKRNMNKELDRCKGSLMGLAVGDALGTTLEFRTPGTFEPLTDLIGGGAFGLKAGQWTDDMSMALCLADSLIEKEDFDPKDQLTNYVNWYRNGYNSSTGSCFDIGNATRQALYRYEKSGDAYCGDSSRDAAGNGSIMRLAPIPLFCLSDTKQMLEMAALSSKTTHASPQCLDACKYMAMILLGAIKGVTKERLLSPYFTLIEKYWLEHPLDKTLVEIAEGTYKQKQPPEIYASGYVVKTLEAALWAFYNTNDFESGALMAVNLGNDADTVGAVYGQIAGAYYGLSGIPEKWLKKIYRALDIEISAECLYNLANKNK